MVGHVVGWKCNNLRSHIVGLVEGFVAIEEHSMSFMRIQKEWWIMAMWPIVGYKFNNDSKSHVVGPILEGFILVDNQIVLIFWPNQCVTITLEFCTQWCNKICMAIIPRIINDIFQIMKQADANVAMINKVATLVKHLEHIPCKLHHFFIQQGVLWFALNHYETNLLSLTFVFLTWQFYLFHSNKVIISLFVEVCLATFLKIN